MVNDIAQIVILLISIHGQTASKGNTANAQTVAQTNNEQFKVKSMSKPDKEYTISRTGNGLVCPCLDNQLRKSDCKHIHVILNIIKQNKCYANNEFKIMERIKLNFY